MVEDNLYARGENTRAERGQQLNGVQKHLEPLPEFARILSPVYITIDSD